ncbi:DHS-like NAD/FAD-binding domain-containing protein [Podospora australis]|uniref:DHS-like NAD/FAD-binding domain-containing protein n=1 Tax=Podospora australis TaxID=1536484 RepID=A0AAN6WYG2_9PEZI|nr:DHS-like NAD/FAD-binding domain-containing protein [Podospora australis]
MAPLRHQTSSPPSSPLSILSQSPSPPTPSTESSMDASKRYPSPSSSAMASERSETPADTINTPSERSDTPGEICVRTDGPPPTKRRRIAAPRRPRTTEYVDLENLGGEEEENLLRLLAALKKKKKIVVIAGAGISVSAGIPDFRSSTGLFTTLRGQHGIKASGKHLFDASVYKHDSSTTSFHNMVRELAQMTVQAKPTAFHHMLASIASEGRLLRLYTQNIDGLDTQMQPLATNTPLNSKGPWPTTIQLHGGLEKMVCTKCNHLEPFKASLFEGPEPPLCEKCKEQDQVRTTFAGKRSHGIGRLRPRIVLYNEFNQDSEAIGKVSQADLRRVPDAVIVVGTTLKIPGVRRLVKEMCQLTRSKPHGLTAWINIDPEPQGVDFKDCWDLVIRGKCDDVAELVNLPRWDQQDIGDRKSYMVTGDKQKEKQYADSVERDRIHVVLGQKRKRDTSENGEDGVQPKTAQTPSNRKSKLIEEGAMPTPVASPKLRNALPVSRSGATKTRSKQSTLVFGATKTENPVAAPARKVSAPKRKPRQPKKENSKPKNTVSQIFKATKAVSVRDTKTPRKQVLDPDSSDLSSPPDLPSDFSGRRELPSLRPGEKTARPAPIMVVPRPSQGDVEQITSGSSPPITPVTAQSSAVDTISPGSKPRSMGHLID